MQTLREFLFLTLKYILLVVCIHRDPVASEENSTSSVYEQIEYSIFPANDAESGAVIDLLQHDVVLSEVPDQIASLSDFQDILTSLRDNLAQSKYSLSRLVVYGTMEDPDLLSSSLVHKLLDQLIRTPTVRHQVLTNTVPVLTFESVGRTDEQAHPDELTITSDDVNHGPVSRVRYHS